MAFVLGDYKFLFTGDAGKDALSEALNYWESCGYEASAFSVVQLPHHGSRKNIDPGILSRLKASEYISWRDERRASIKKINQQNFRNEFKGWDLYDSGLLKF